MVGTPIEQSSVVWFTPEFLSVAQRFTTTDWSAECSDLSWWVDWSHAACAMVAWQHYKIHDCCRAACVKNTRVIRQSMDGGSVIWLLTGEYDWEKNLYEGRWPD